MIALLSDVHGNIEALHACLKHAREAGAERHAFLGDFAGYGADVQAVCETIARYAGDGAVAVMGNHDEAIEKSAAYMNEAAQEAIEWGRRTLSPDMKRFLSGLPMIVREPPVCYVHSSAASPERWDYIDSPAAARRSIEASRSTYTFSGHVHDQVLYFETAVGKLGTYRPLAGSPVPLPAHRRWLALVGSVGQPRDRNPAAAYALFDEERATITFHRVPYDHLTAARKIRNAGLPESLALRVERGF